LGSGAYTFSCAMPGVGARHVLACFTPALLALPLWAQPALREYGQKITLGFPNEHNIMGIGGLSYDPASQVWSAVAEEMRGTEASMAHPATADPRLYSLKLDFDSGSLAVAEPPVVRLRPGAGLKLEDIAGPNPDGSFWVVSEANSHLRAVSQLVSKNLLAAPDLSTFDPDTFENSRLVRVRAEDGTVLEDVMLPDFVRWDARFSWDPYECVGNRPFQGFHGASALLASAPGGQRTLVVGIQSALYQDGPSPTEFEGSRTRLLFYDLPGDNATLGGASARYSRAYRYDTSHLTMKVFEKGARHFNALSGVLALSDTSLLVAEIEDFTGFGGIETISRIFHVRLQPADTVDHCRSLASCNVSAPAKALLWERPGKLQLDGISRGPTVTVEGTQWPTVALVYESDDKVGAEFELLALNEAALYDGSTPLWAASVGPEALRRERIAVVIAALAVAAFIALAQWPAVHFFCPTRSVAARVVRPHEESGARREPWVPKLTSAHYLLWSCIANSTLVGGLTFGFQGMVLILWKQGVYTDTCACGKFCAGFKEQMAVISTLGFFVSIGSRIFLGFVLDSVGPKITSVASSFTCFAAFLVLAVASDDGLGSVAMAAWLLLAFGGAGMHISGFHTTQLFNNEGRVAASAGISAGFGASSLVFPLMQVLHQYADWQLQSMAAFYAGLVLLITVNNFVAQPWEKVQGGMNFQIDLRVHRRAWWRRDARWKPVLHSVREVLGKFEFWGEALFYSISMLLLTHYLGTSVHLMVEKGDVPLTSNPNDWTDYMFSRLAGLFNSLGFIWFPLVEGMMLRYRWSTCYLALLAVQLAFAVVLLLPSLEVQVLGFLLQSLGRLMLFSFHHAYIQDRFGSEYFGTLNGISSLMAAILSLLSYPFQLLSVFALKGNFSMLFVPIGALLLLSALFPLIHRRIPLFNWAETACVDPLKFRYPTTEREVVELVRNARTLRCAGAMHSCAPLIDTDGIILCLGRMDRIIEIDVGKKTARVQAGVRIHDLCEALKPEGLAVGTLGTIDWQTFVGAVMTGTHGGFVNTPYAHGVHRAVRGSGMGLKHSGAIAGSALHNIAEKYYAVHPAVMAKYRVYSYTRYEDDILLLHSDNNFLTASYIARFFRLCGFYTAEVVERSTSAQNSVQMLNVRLTLEESGMVTCEPVHKSLKYGLPLAQDSIHPPALLATWPAALAASMQAISLPNNNARKAVWQLTRYFDSMGHSARTVCAMLRTLEPRQADCRAATSVAGKPQSMVFWISLMFHPTTHQARLNRVLLRVLQNPNHVQFLREMGFSAFRVAWRMPPSLGCIVQHSTGPMRP